MDGCPVKYSGMSCLANAAYRPRLCVAPAPAVTTDHMEVLCSMAAIVMVISEVPCPVSATHGPAG